MLFGLRTRLAAVAFSVTYVLGNTWKYSLGKIDHDILIVVVPLVLAMSGWDRRYALDARRLGGTSRAEGWTVALLMFIVGLSMFAAGLQKLLGGWLDPGSQAVQSYVLFNHYANGHDPLAWGLVSKISAWWAWEAQDVLTVILELAFLPMIFWRRGAQVICVVAVAFHLGVLLTLDISFSANLLAYGVLVRWDRLRAWPVAARAMARAEGFLEGIRQWHVFLFGSALALAYLTIGNPFEHAPTLLWSDMPITSWLIMLIAVAISVAYLWFYLRGGVSSPDAAPAPAEAEPQEVEQSAKH